MFVVLILGIVSSLYVLTILIYLVGLLISVDGLTNYAIRLPSKSAISLPQ